MGQEFFPDFWKSRDLSSGPTPEIGGIGPPANCYPCCPTTGTAATSRVRAGRGPNVDGGDKIPGLQFRRATSWHEKFVSARPRPDDRHR